MYQLEEDLLNLLQFDKAIRDGFVDGKPLHVADPEKSAFKVMTESEFEQKSVEEIQEIFRRKHIVITDMRSPPLKFDAKGLRTLSPLSRITFIQGG